jgi:hypothetical protein
MNEQLSLFCQHIFECPTPNGQKTVVCICKLCGAKQENRVYIAYNELRNPLVLKQFKINYAPFVPIDRILESGRHEKRHFNY